MLVIALNRRKILTYLKLSLIILTVFSILIWTFEQLPQQISFEKWNASNDHPGRVLRVNFGFDKQPDNGFDKTLGQIKKYYQEGFKSH